MFRFGGKGVLPASLLSLMIAAPFFIYFATYAIFFIIILGIPVGIFAVAFGRRRRW